MTIETIETPFTIDCTMDFGRAVKWIDRCLSVREYNGSLLVELAGIKRWWCARRVVVSVYPADSHFGRLYAPKARSEWIAVYDTALADDRVVEVRSVEQVAAIAVEWAALGSPEDRAAIRMDAE